MTNVLIIAAHPDDEVLGCGGTIARLAREGANVTIAILGEGMTSRYSDRNQAPREDLSLLQSDSQRAADLLGAKALRTFDLPDNRFDTVPMLEVAKIIEGLIDETKPDRIFTQHGGDLNVDHVVIYRATLTAARPMEASTVQAVYSYEVASSTEWAFQSFAPNFTPQLFVDISDTLELKVSAMELYQSERRAFPHPRSPEALRAAAIHHGSAVGLRAAEAFHIIYDCRSGKGKTFE